MDRDEPIYALVTGSRFWADRKVVEEELRLLPPHAILVHGDCRGADHLAEAVWKSWGRKTIACAVTSDEWKRKGPRAGPERNRHMLEAYPPITAVAFPLSESRGTAHMMGLLHGRNIHFIERGQDYRTEHHRPQTKISSFFAKGL